MSTVIIFALLVIVYFQWQYIGDLRWWKKYLSERRDDAEKMNRKLLERLTGVKFDSEPDEIDWDEDTLEV